VNTLSKVAELKEAGQDFEWYPTTDDMIDMISARSGVVHSVLDIGAGDGRVLERLDKLNFRRKYKDDGCKEFHSTIDKYAIEKSTIHIENMPPDISIIGTDFYMQTLIDKKVDMVFCNPPYSEYEDWAVKTIKEANTKTIFLVIPSRWADSKLIRQAIKQRNAIDKVIWRGDFADADRAARAEVNILKIVIASGKRGYEGGYEGNETDPFNVWFEEYFSDFTKIKIKIESEEDEDESEEVTKTDPIKEIVEGQNLIERLQLLYVKEMNNLLNNYKNLSQLDATLLNELGVSVDGIKKALKLKIEGIKNKYWKELFDNLDKITNRLTSKSRETMLEKLRASCNVDFTTDNAYAVVLWAIKNANQYIDQQLTEVFRELSEPDCVKNYKSNINTWEKDRWRYKDRNKHTHYMLEYRIVSERHDAIQTEEFSCYYTNNLSDNCHKFINDIFTVAKNLGFSMASFENSNRRQWESNQEQEFSYQGGTLAKIRAFKNGNIHLKLDQKFIKTLNVEAARLLKWIKTPQQAVDEMGLDFDFVKARFNSNLLFGVSDGVKLLTK